MANSLRTKLKKLAYDGKITQSDLDELLCKLDGHDKQIRNVVIKEIKEWVLTSRPDTVAKYKCSDGVMRYRPLYDCHTICEKLEFMKGVK